MSASLISYRSWVRCYNTASWQYGIFTTGLILVLEGLRQVHVAMPAPFLSILGAVAMSAGLGGMEAGLISSISFSAYILYAALLHSGPATITEGPIEVTSGILVGFCVALVLGYGRQRFDQQVRSLQRTRQQLDQQVQASEEQLNMALDAAHMGIWDWDMQTGKITWNHWHSQLFGIPNGDFDGRYETFDACLHPADRDGLNQAVKRAIENHEFYQYEFRVIWSNGSVHWIDGRGRAFYDETGQPIRMAGTVMGIDDRVRANLELELYHSQLERLVAARTEELSDVNQRLQAELRSRQVMEATLREADRRWRSLLENVHLLVSGSDVNCVLNYANPQYLKTMGYTAEECLGKSWLELLYPPEMQDQIRASFKHLVRHETYRYHEGPLLTKTGEERLIAWNITVLRSPEGEPLGTMSIGEDITQRSQLDRLKDEFISVIGHEVRTPLTSVYTALNMLRDQLVPLESERGQRLIELAAQGAEQLLTFVNDILDLERLESGKLQLVKRACNLTELMERAIALVALMAEQAEVEIVMQPLDVQLFVDPDRLIQVLTNLLSNAIKFSPKGATVRLMAVQTKQGVQIVVSDQGRGIPRDKLEIIFDRFQQVDASDARQKGGTGLGLAICRNLVQQHGGQIWAESELGHGSQFYIKLPL